MPGSRILGGLSMLGKKKVISIGMALLLLVGVAGCGKKNDSGGGRCGGQVHEGHQTGYPHYL